MDDQNKNLILATALSFLVILVWFLLFPPEEAQLGPQDTSNLTLPDADTTTTGSVPTVAGNAPSGTKTAEPTAPAAVANAPRIEIKTPKLTGSVSTLGGRIDDLSLNDYNVELNGEEKVHLLNPVGEVNAFYALYGWAPGAGLTPADVPGTETLWQVESGTVLTDSNAIGLRWDSPSGLIFRRTISVDENYLFTIEQSVENPTASQHIAAPYGIVARHGLPELENFFIVHEGLVGMQNDELLEEDYDTITEYDLNPAFGARAQSVADVQGGWLGFTDKYWMATLIPDPAQPADHNILYQERANIYTAQTVLPAQTIAPGATVTTTSQLFAGAKEWEVIRAYQNEGGITKFLDSIDWGWFYFLTKPIFALLHWLNNLIGNMGWAILGLTLLIKALLFPLAYKSNVSMAKMKELQPQLQKLKETAGDDRQKMQQEMMALYKKEKVNPMAGCMPILLQIPIFFSLYKVIFVTIELRHAPWLGPFQDLSAPDPTSIMNLFGLLPNAAPDPGSIIALIFIGILPLLLGISMWMQQKLNPAPTDPTQAAIFAWMPWVFMFMLGGFASGLVIYWIANNVITFTQQYVIMRTQGIKPDVFGNIKSSFKKKPKTDAK